ncbi:NUDIX hydrolase [Corynebacterium sp. 153RC1]|uniref:NUDIX hydrolase n=1 Tax=unclassified Corynebacterium TaxID=2624378 RepID=UPI00211CB214|nr:NUDIX hydrolase [Corynebacterium sp. 209RC1]MCQ9355016.1 NUDIX hydrolase [Corynebacterium sp. 1222RC1]MCQ9356141.1 NUDIX hydrolase [Corynebacterium sp. 122RC1]MCQ9359536.1 NUDIX hydrolase [Corynebacterium sp. 142RC1]MCQ9360755.1 NUDIX hydrolase [Corynebacterium sp. 153RC1]MCQ9363799.1 NUDIX hydrolase [Corynebacterium sp. 732RC1]MCQ9364582.1 NUDIX hydrolase [Corynebacterium sp. 70RC1]
MTHPPVGPLRDHAGTAKFRHQAVAVVLRVTEQLEVLTHTRQREPFPGLPELPSGPVEVDESLDQSVIRHLRNLLNRSADAAKVAHFEQLVTRGEVGRDPFDRTIATAYLGLTPQAHEGQWLPVAGLREMAFDHLELVELAVARLRGKLSYTNIAFALMPEAFSLAQLSEVYCAVLGYEVSVTNLKRVLSRRGVLEPTGDVVKPAGGGRPAALYRFASQRLVVTDPFAAFRPS